MHIEGFFWYNNALDRLCRDPSVGLHGHGPPVPLLHASGTARRWALTKGCAAAISTCAGLSFGTPGSAAIPWGCRR